MTDLTTAQSDLDHARAQLQAFLDRADEARLLARLQEECPSHATRIGMLAMPLAALFLSGVAVGWLGLPLLGHSSALMVARLDPHGMLPIVVLVNALAALVLAVVFRRAAVARGRLSPLQAHERREHAGLMGAVWRCEARLALAEADLAA